ncbi:microfibril-associated glycoprotein 4-like [Uranotaenia lowii]|uniref:microfibril-associated glycoprotein 4-like n=1 Tax=Uranotaenia lowii TaxID=190385 RepID=UPI00247AA6BA|nr:microfibril-associated glycoprotein 4-like [Uranotaenia lowii]
MRSKISVRYFYVAAQLASCVVAVFGFPAGASNSEDKGCGFGYELLLSKLDSTNLGSQMQIDAIAASIRELKESVSSNVLSSVVGPKSLNFPKTCRRESQALQVIQPELGFQEPFLVKCDQNSEVNGWIVIQHRFDGSVNFLRTWNEYKSGFGHLDGEFWLGLDKIHQLTFGAPHELLVVLEDWEGKRVEARYSEFAIDSEQKFYALSKLGTYSGTAGDSLTPHKNARFSTFDRDNDDLENSNCATVYSGAWWYVKCHSSNLNGLYLRGNGTEYAVMMCWYAFQGHYYSLKESKMMIRRKN